MYVFFLRCTDQKFNNIIEIKIRKQSKREERRKNEGKYNPQIKYSESVCDTLGTVSGWSQGDEESYNGDSEGQECARN